MHSLSFIHQGLTFDFPRLLPHRNGTRPVNHALTSFNNVVLPASALLDSPDHLDRNVFMASLFRVAVGSIALGTTAASILRVVASIGARYSLRRTVIGNGSTPSPIINFRTQQIPIFTALAQAHVVRAFDKWAVDAFRDVDMDPRVRHGIAACFKVTAVQLSQAANLSVSDRCGAQGVFEHNQMSVLHVSMFRRTPNMPILILHRPRCEASPLRKEISWPCRSVSFTVKLFIRGGN